MWEEYRYDPLGRRILVRTRTNGGLCDVDPWTCTGSITRFIWAGDQILWELKAPGNDGADLEATTGPGASYGRVSYTHAGGVDRPLVITKNDVSVIPHQNWRGMFALGTNPAGGRDVPDIDWPGFHTTPWHGATRVVENWFGSLSTEMRDATGQLYKRNRYYDPASGQFTQPDPIGLAGGLNSYGFAAGDPVSYSDPYGLCPKELQIRKNVCPGGLSIPQYDDIKSGAEQILLGEARTRILTMLDAGDIVLVGSTGNGRPAGADWRGPDNIQVTAAFFGGTDDTGYDRQDERMWVLGHELGHLIQAENGLLIRDLGNANARPNHRRIRRELDLESDAVQNDANKYACASTTTQGDWGPDKC